MGRRKHKRLSTLRPIYVRLAKLEAEIVMATHGIAAQRECAKQIRADGEDQKRIDAVDRGMEQLLLNHARLLSDHDRLRSLLAPSRVRSTVSANNKVVTIEQTTRALSRSNRAFDLLELFVPKRVAAEEIGDAMESISSLIRQSRPNWQIYVKLIFTIFWVLVHAVHQVIKGPAKSPKKND